MGSTVMDAIRVAISRVREWRWAVRSGALIWRSPRRRIWGPGRKGGGEVGGGGRRRAGGRKNGKRRGSRVGVRGEAVGVGGEYGRMKARSDDWV